MFNKGLYSLLLLCILNTQSFAQLLKVDSVQVDSIWNSDSLWYNNAVLQTRTSRDFILSFIPSSQGTVSCSLNVSLDSGKTFDRSYGLLRIIDTSYGFPDPKYFSSPFISGARKRYHIRLLIGDTDGVVIRVYCRQYVPSIKGNPKNIFIVGPVDSLCSILLQTQELIDSVYPNGKLAKYYWDTLGINKFDVSSNAAIYNWNTTIPDYTKEGDCFKRIVLVQAKDINGTLSPTDSFVIYYCPESNKVDTGTFILGSYANAAVGSSVDLDSGIVKLVAQAKLFNSGIDLVGTYSDRYFTFRLFNPVYASSSSNIAAFQDWDNPSHTSICKVSGVNFDEINLKKQISLLYSITDTVSISSCQQGDILIVKTDQEKYVMIQVVSYDPTPAGTGTIRYKR